MKFAQSFIAALLFVSLAAVSVAAADNQHIIRRNTRDKSGVERALGDENIVGGVNVSGQEFPFFVQGAGAIGESCAASLILPDVILTAAYCVDSFLNASQVLVGSYHWNDTSSNDAQWRSVISGTQRIHPKYMDSRHPYNAAVIKIEAVTLTNLKPINLNMDTSEPMENEKLWMMGYGDTLRQLPNVGGPFSYPTVLQKVDLKLVDFPRCVSMYQSENETADWFTVYDTSLMCAADVDKGGCKGDGGAPLIREVSPAVYELVGIGLDSYGCALNGFPGIFSNVADLYGWITTTAHEISAFSFPTPSPTKAPTRSPTSATNRPTSVPTLAPTSRPTSSPTAKKCHAKGDVCKVTPKLPCCTQTPKLVCLGTTKKCGACVKKGKKCKAKGDCCKKVCVRGVCAK